jgi:Domain of unknown function (DUF4411)
VTKFLIDSNSLIDAKDRGYAFDICPGFWNAILRHHQHGEIFSIERIRDELLDGNDILVKWVKLKVPTTFFLNSRDASVAKVYGQIIQWVQANYQMESAVNSFASKADGWLIASAKVGGYTIVTEEVFNPAKKNRVPNPNVCHQFGIPFCNTFHMLRTLKAKFGLRKLTS